MVHCRRMDKLRLRRTEYTLGQWPESIRQTGRGACVCVDYCAGSYLTSRAHAADPSKVRCARAFKYNWVPRAWDPCPKTKGRPRYMDLDVLVGWVAKVWLHVWLLSDLIYTPRKISCSMWPAQNLPSRKFSSVTERDGNKQVRWVTGRENMIWTDME